MKLFSILTISALLLTGCSEFSGNQYVFYGTIQNKQERIKYIDIEEDTYITGYGNEDIYSTGYAINRNTIGNAYAINNKRVKPVREITYTVKLRNGKIVTINQENGPSVSVNQKVAVHYYPSGLGEVIPVQYNIANGNGRVIVPCDSVGNKMVIEL